MSLSFEVFFDYSSPWTYLAFSQVRALAARSGARPVFRPFLVGAVFNTINPTVYAARKNPVPRCKVRYMNGDLQEWAEAYGVTIKGPYEEDPADRVSPFPVNSAKALRGALYILQSSDASAASPAAFYEYSDRMFAAYWSNSRDISQLEVIRDVAQRTAGVDADALVAYVGSPEAKAALRRNTEELIARGGFGSPTFFASGGRGDGSAGGNAGGARGIVESPTSMYFGNDRLPLLERRLREIVRPSPVRYPVTAFAARGQWPKAASGPVACASADAMFDDEARFGRTSQLLVIRAGEIIYERHGAGQSAASTCLSWSMAKSWVHALVGVAIQKGLLPADLHREVWTCVKERAGRAGERGEREGGESGRFKMPCHMFVICLCT
jgi:2-hydroxychromene-2-carboxylate isomerase